MRFIGQIAVLGLFATPLAAQEMVNISPDIPSLTVQTPSGPMEISRVQDTTNKVDGEWALTSRPCPPFCIQPMTPAPGVTTIGELELLEMLADETTTVVDSRTSDWFEGGTIPGSVNIPYKYMVDSLGDLGCDADFEGWDCTETANVALFCNGLWCGQSPTAIRAMISAGYPAERVFYYRGGMQSWRSLGLSVSGAGD